MTFEEEFRELVAAKTSVSLLRDLVEKAQHQAGVCLTRTLTDAQRAEIITVQKALEVISETLKPLKLDLLNAYNQRRTPTNADHGNNN